MSCSIPRVSSDGGTQPTFVHLGSVLLARPFDRRIHVSIATSLYELHVPVLEQGTDLVVMPVVDPSAR